MRGTLVATQVPWYGGSASVDCSATIIARPRDATQYFNHTTSMTSSPVWGTHLVRQEVERRCVMMIFIHHTSQWRNGVPKRRERCCSCARSSRISHL